MQQRVRMAAESGISLYANADKPDALSISFQFDIILLPHSRLCLGVKRPLDAVHQVSPALVTLGKGSVGRFVLSLSLIRCTKRPVCAGRLCLCGGFSARLLRVHDLTKDRVSTIFRSIFWLDQKKRAEQVPPEFHRFFWNCLVFTFGLSACPTNPSLERCKRSGLFVLSTTRHAAAGKKFDEILAWNRYQAEQFTDRTLRPGFIPLPDAPKRARNVPSDRARRMTLVMAAAPHRRRRSPLPEVYIRPISGFRFSILGETTHESQ